MSSNFSTDQRIRALFGSGLVSWILLAVSLFTPEWTRQGIKHCGVIFCCYELYGNCSITQTSIVEKEFSYVFSSWMFCFVAICSSTCRFTDVKPENVRQMAALMIISGVLALTGSTEFFVRKFTSDELNFAACGFVTHIAGWIEFIAGCCGFCHGYNYTSDSTFFSNDVFPVNRGGGIERAYGPIDSAIGTWKKMQRKGEGAASVSGEIPE